MIAGDDDPLTMGAEAESICAPAVLDRGRGDDAQLSSDVAAAV
jgi:hypothetical protein